MLLIAAGALGQAVIRTGSGWAVEVPGLILVDRIVHAQASARRSRQLQPRVPCQGSGTVTGLGSPTGHRPQSENTEPEDMARPSKVRVGFGDSKYSAIRREERPFSRHGL
jgi:hypothetical protein